MQPWVEERVRTWGNRVPKQDHEPFELDEPGARSHSPPGWSIETIEIKPIGKAPKHYGPDTYRFAAALTLSVILPRRGWTLVKRTKNHAYLTPPADCPNPPFRISIAVPPDEECVAIASRSFAKGESWMGQLGEWPAWYLHERNRNIQQLSRDPATGAIVAHIIEHPCESSLTIGEWGVWKTVVTGIEGHFRTGFLPPDFPLSPVPVVPVAPESTLWEGLPNAIELTVYERNPRARRLCIEHYGPTCQVCTLNYEEKYGAIGAGLIHVHHVTPLSTIRDGYEVDPIHDLVPLCATCHHVAHSRVPPYAVDELRTAIANAASA